MRLRATYRIPEDREDDARRARRLEWTTIGFLLSITVVIYFTMGGSQAMKTAWIEDVLSLVPPIAYLIADSVRDRQPNARFPYGYQRAMSLSFLVAAVSLLILGLYMVWDSGMGLVRAEHPTLSHRELLGIRTWEGWFMIAALAYSAIPPVVLGRMKLPLARRLHDKTLHADAAMNKADWMTALAGILGILGIGLGFWWADSAAALFISLEVVKDGVTNVKNVFADLADQRPTQVDRAEPDGLPDEVDAALRALPWVREARVRFREEGRTVAGEAFVVPVGDGVTLEQLQEAARVVHDQHWRIYDVVVTAVADLDDRRHPNRPDGKR